MAVQKISVISLDHWNYDQHIVTTLQKKGIEATHINFGKYQHAHFLERIKNAYAKLFLKQNPKKIKRQEYILETLTQLGTQDQILVINPDLIDKKYHLEIKKHTHKYIAYLYDSMARYPVEHLLDGVFDSIFSFDPDDVKQFDFQKTTNYIYLNKQPLRFLETPKYEAFYIGTRDSRLLLLKQIAQKLDFLKKSYFFIIVEKKNWKKKIAALIIKDKEINAIQYRKHRVRQEDMSDFYDNTNVIVDLVRDQQSGLSFRIFEAMAFQKKIITSNTSIKEYDFYNSNNIMVLEENQWHIDPEFFKTPYEPIPEAIYQRYTLEHWVGLVFEI